MSLTVQVLSLSLSYTTACLLTKEFGTHKVLQDGIAALTCMEHRGACGGDGVSGDGAGIMTQIPWKLLSDHRHGVYKIQTFLLQIQVLVRHR